jgi:hypothetical protein
MKKSVFLFLLISNLLVGQKNYLGISIGYNANQFNDFQNEDLVNDFHDGKSFDLGLYFQSVAKENLFYSIGVDYTNISILLDYEIRDLIGKNIKTNYRVISFPIEIQRDFLEYFFIKAGILPHFEIQNIRDNSNYFDGIGASMSLGLKFSKDNFHFSLAPHFKLYSLVKFKESIYNYTLSGAGIRLNTGYNF